MNKDFRKQIEFFKQKLENKEPFAFARFSDGELAILMNWYTELSGMIKFGPEGSLTEVNYSYPVEDHKVFDPKIHSFFRDRLIEAFLYEKTGYYKGILSGDQSVDMYNFQFKLLNKTKEEVTEDPYFTYADLFVNGNYPYFLDHLMPLFSNYKTVIVCNERADLSRLPIPIIKDFRVGYNCFVNNYGIIEELKKYISDNNIEEHLFLFSASSLSKVAIHQLYEFNDRNTYLDIGTCLNIFLRISIDRNYLRGYWLNSGEPDINRFNKW